MKGIERFSPKQRQVLSWWCPPAKTAGKLGIICDGAVRSGKTFCLGLSFVAWSLAAFQGRTLPSAGGPSGR